jgi:hypothetical protein
MARLRGRRRAVTHRTTVVLDVDLLASGHDAIAGRVLFRPVRTESWQVAPLLPLGNEQDVAVELLFGARLLAAGECFL